jgi:1-acyl-sn-glycerol-3-phosphate acyltransferase
MIGRMVSALDRGWRLIATGLSFLLFGIGGLALALAVFPFLNVGFHAKDLRQRIAQRVVQRTWRLYIRIMAVLGVLTYECRGEALLKTDHGVMVVANHPSLLDIVFLMAFMQRTKCVVKSGVWNNPFMAGVVRAAGYIPNLGDPERLLEDCAQAMREGNNVVVFPEGSRTVPGQPRKMQRGFAYAALKAGAPVRLATITVSPPTLLKGEPWYRIPRHRPHWTIQIHDRIDVFETAGHDPLPVAARHLVTRVDSLMDEMLRA